MTISAMSSGVSGLQRATQRLETSAARIANPATPGADMAEDMIAMLMAKLDFEASTKIIKTASAMQKSAIDILA